MTWGTKSSTTASQPKHDSIPSPNTKIMKFNPLFFFASLVSLQSLNHLHLSLPHLECSYYLTEVNAAEYSARQQAGQDRWSPPGSPPGLFLYGLVQGAHINHPPSTAKHQCCSLTSIQIRELIMKSLITKSPGHSLRAPSSFTIQ